MDNGVWICSVTTYKTLIKGQKSRTLMIKLFRMIFNLLGEMIAKNQRRNINL